jgi:hypothetical protein
MNGKALQHPILQNSNSKPHPVSYAVTSQGMQAIAKVSVTKPYLLRCCGPCCLVAILAGTHCQSIKRPDAGCPGAAAGKVSPQGPNAMVSLWLLLGCEGQSFRRWVWKLTLAS